MMPPCEFCGKESVCMEGSKLCTACAEMVARLKMWPTNKGAPAEEASKTWRVRRKEASSTTFEA